MTRVRRLLLLSTLTGLSAAVAVPVVGLHRYSDHRGLSLVAVDDHSVDGLDRASLPVPRRTYVIVFDGLGYEEGSRVPSIRWVGDRGQCLRTDVSPFAVSRPVYSAISTGLEQDRTGVRSNYVGDRLAAESIWTIARQAGLTVSAVSDVDWWRELFPEGFSSYRKIADSENFFVQADPADVMLIHPVYVDHTGHAFGAASPEYKAAVDRANSELRGFLRQVDLTRDLIVVTADHGHSLRGGHGGLEDRVAHVITCYAGVGVRPSRGIGTMPMSNLAPSLAVLLGLRFPRHMRAGDDQLDAIWSLTDQPAAYLQRRREAVNDFRRANAEVVPQGWNALYGTNRRDQRIGMTMVVLISLAGALGVLRRGRSWRAALMGLGWGVCFWAAAILAHVLVKGGFDWTSTNGRFLVTTAVLIAGVLLVFIIARRLLIGTGGRAAWETLAVDLSGLIVFGVVLIAGHLAIYGWAIRIPMAEPAMVLFPYFGSIVVGIVSCAGLPLYRLLR